ncbi:MAG TPA: signal peptidase I [Acidobacteriaceae bacterium]|jgi:signal peptidase I|nr:signal peptidase I [Acidobacteriaceae bacterium]
MAEILEKQAKQKEHHEETPLEAFASICGVLAVGLFILTFIFQNFAIPSSSMVSALLVGDHVLVDRITLAPPAHYAPFVYYRDVHRGDIVVFYKPTLEPDGEHLFLVKRVMGIPGDRIHLRNGIVYRNGVALDEPYAGKPTDGDYVPYRDDFPAMPPAESPDVTAEWAEALPATIQGQDLVVPAGLYFCMGDNRTVSLDSRYWGFVPRKNIVGRPLFVYWSFVTPESEENRTSVGDRVGWILHETIHFFDQTRWRRTLHRVK